MPRKIYLALNNTRAINWLKEKLTDDEIYSGNIDFDEIEPQIIVAEKAPKEKPLDLIEKVKRIKDKVINDFIFVVAFGVLDEESTPVFEKLKEMGVPEDLIITSKAGKNVTSSQLLKGIQKAIKAIPEEEEDPPLWESESDTEDNNIPDPEDKQPGVFVRVFSFKRGSGCDTIATSLVGHLADAGLKAALVDQGCPATAAFHMQLENPAAIEIPSVYETKWGDLVVPDNVGDFHRLIPELKAKYDVIIVNQPGVLLPVPDCDISILVLDQDWKSVLITTEKIKSYHPGGQLITIINKSMPQGVPVDAISEDLGIQPVVIDYDYDSCNSALANFEPALTKSSPIASGIGQIVGTLGLLGGR